MVLGLRTRTRKGTSVHIDYLVHIEGIKPWPTSKSMTPIQSVMLQWENSEQNSGSLLSSVGEGEFRFNESFRVPVTLWREASGKDKLRDSFRKCCLELNLYELRKDKTAKLFGMAVINLAEFGIIKETLRISVPINCKRRLRNTAQPVMFVKMQPVEKDSLSSSPKSSLSKEVSLDHEGSEGVSGSLNEENDEEIEIASFTDDDDDNLHSSRTISSSSAEVTGVSLPLKEGKGSESAKEIMRRGHRLPTGHPGAESSIPQVIANSVPASSADSQDNVEAWRHRTKSQGAATAIDNTHVGLLADPEGDKRKENGHGKEILGEKYPVKNERADKYSQGSLKKQLALQGRDISGDEPKDVTSMISAVDLTKNNKPLKSNSLLGKGKTVGGLVSHRDPGNFVASEGKERSSSSLDGKSELKSRVKVLEEELCEAAAVEAGLYSVVAEHGSSTNKVHAPARRLSRFYLHACRARSQVGRASAARAVVSGLVLVSKTCGNDVPRLSFWLSNSVVLRAIISKVLGEKPTRSWRSSNDEGKGPGKSDPHVLHESSPTECRSIVVEGSEDWEDLQAFIIVLEKIEAWIFARIVESVWWQTLTPHMQSSATNCNGTKGSNSRKARGYRYDLSDQEHGNFSIELWEKAFKDACERLCPIRAEGHECGCLPILARLVMEQLVNRLDVAMFNAILRESAEEMPTDPVSDPICDSKVLPIPAGKSSFRAGAQLKNAIGSWSRWLTDLFVVDDSSEDSNQLDQAPFKIFPLLHALSDLMMLPLEMLSDTCTRKEVCPAFGVVLIKRVLNNFVPDEFCPDPVPQTLFDSLDSEELLEDPEECITSFPCNAAPTLYSPPVAASLASILGEVGGQTLQRRRSSVLRKSYTSDDELDELDSPLASIIADDSNASSSKLKWMLKGTRNVTRYRLLHDVWRNGE